MRWREIGKQMEKLNLGYKFPEQPDPKGCIIIGEKRLGIWLMPNNQTHGILENFISWMVPNKADNELWKHVEDSIGKLPNGPIFPEKDLAKAQLATWLAWQEEPGHPIGLAVTKGYVDAHSETVDAFIDWIKRLFEL